MFVRKQKNQIDQINRTTIKISLVRRVDQSTPI